MKDQISFWSVGLAKENVIQIFIKKKSDVMHMIKLNEFFSLSWEANDWFEQVLFPVRVIEGNNQWKVKILRIYYEKEHISSG